MFCVIFKMFYSILKIYIITKYVYITIKNIPLFCIMIV